MVRIYRIVKALDSGMVEETVEDLLRAGWKLHGSLAIHHTLTNQTLYAQAMTREAPKQ